MLLDCIFLLLRPVGSMVVVRSMAEEKRRGNERQASGGRIGSRRAALDLSSSGDVRSAITHLRANLHRAVPIGELAAETGVSERTLRDHFQRFIGLSPSDYGLRLRLNAVDYELRRWSNPEPIASIARRYGFPHPGRFAHQYHRAFGKTPSETRQAAAASSRSPNIAAPASRGDRPEILIQPFTAPAGLSDHAGALGDRIAIALLGEARIFRPQPGRRRDYPARYRIQGQLTGADDRFQIRIGLIDTEIDAQLWGDAWSGRVADALSVIERVVAAAAGAVLPSIRQSESERVKGMRPQDMNAYQLCLGAYPLLTAATAPDTRQALDLLHRAIERDPDYALPMAFAAWGYAQLVMQLGSASPAEDRAKALRLSTQAGTLDQFDPLVLTARSVVHTMADDRLYADDLVTRALARRPSLAWAWERSGWLRAYAADMRGATAHFGRALRLDPSNSAKTTLALAGISAGLFDRGRYDLAVRWMRRALELEPGAAWINRTLAVTYSQLGERGLAVQSLETLRRYRPGIRIRDVVSAMHFAPEFVSRVANGLDDLGLPP